jgi:hypothetical protein
VNTEIKTKKHVKWFHKVYILEQVFDVYARLNKWGFYL